MKAYQCLMFLATSFGELGQATPDLVDDEGVVTDFWDAAAEVRHPGFDTPLAQFRELIRSTQEPTICADSNVCRVSSYVGGTGSNLKRLAHHLLAAVLHGKAIVGRYPGGQHSRLSTNMLLRQRCEEEGRLANECYLQPVSTCHTPLFGKNSSRHEHQLDKCPSVSEPKVMSLMDLVANRTGLRSEALIMGSLQARILRPQPELRAAIKFYGRNAGFGSGGRHRIVSMHLRRGDKHSLYTKHLKNDSYRVSPVMSNLWARRVASDIGAEKAIFMSDDKHMIRILTHQSDGFFLLAPAPAVCLPSYTAGLLGVGRAAITLTGKKMQSYSTRQRESRDNFASPCGEPYFVDDGIQFFAGIVLMAQSAAFIGTQVSNIDSVVVELMSNLQHPAVYYDVFNDLHRSYTSDENAWVGGSHFSRREAEKESLATTGASRLISGSSLIDDKFVQQSGTRWLNRAANVQDIS